MADSNGEQARNPRGAVTRSIEPVRSRILLAAMLAVATYACAPLAPTQPADSPAWLRALITRIESEPVTNPPSSIVRYRYRGEMVYFRPSRCCDVYSDLYDSTGVLICHPDGGITGGGDGRCSDFAAARSDGQVVWADSRR